MGLSQIPSISRLPPRHTHTSPLSPAPRPAARHTYANAGVLGAKPRARRTLDPRQSPAIGIRYDSIPAGYEPPDLENAPSARAMPFAALGANFHVFARSSSAPASSLAFVRTIPTSLSAASKRVQAASQSFVRSRVGSDSGPPLLFAIAIPGHPSSELRVRVRVLPQPTVLSSDSVLPASNAASLQASSDSNSRISPPTAISVHPQARVISASRCL
ncbi:hypothetical protein MVEN_01750000 [Mycena venus]|uniref:Uncharacterized protein n=1 Tax=Mycena venus TaxID=2733690 RepID=A0A8H6XKB8_9AGAR|nr:hypothetical protein MVEN_01750000 [Mycena venus]